MYRQEVIKPYGEGEKAKQVEEMFDNIAPSYDKLNHRLSWNIDKGWRRKAIRQLAPFKPQTLLDIATGTGDFAILAAEMLHPQKLVGADISEGMMEIGRKKVREKGLQDIISFAKEDCLHLSYQDETFDAVTAAFGIRNFADLDSGLREMQRVLRKGGHLSIVELTSPVSFPMKQLFHVYSQGHQRLQLSDEDHRGIPAGRADGGDPSQGRIQRGQLQAPHLRHLYNVFREEINIVNH